MASQEQHSLSSFGKGKHLGLDKLTSTNAPAVTPTPIPSTGKTHATVAPVRQATPTPKPSPADRVRKSVGAVRAKTLGSKAVGKSLGKVEVGASEIIRGDTKSGQAIPSEGTYLKYDNSVNRGAAASTGTDVGTPEPQRRRLPKRGPRKHRTTGVR